MRPSANPDRVGWVHRIPQTADEAMQQVLSPTGFYQPTDEPVCGYVENVDPSVTKDEKPRTFICDKPKGHQLDDGDAAHRHIYTEEDELIRDGHKPEDAWWVAIETR